MIYYHILALASPLCIIAANCYHLPPLTMADWANLRFFLHRFDRLQILSS